MKRNLKVDSWMAFEDPTQHPVRVALDIMAGSGIAVSFLDILPKTLSIVGGILGVIWFALQIYDHHLVQQWMRQRRARKLERLQQAIEALQARDQRGLPKL